MGGGRGRAARKGDEKYIKNVTQRTLKGRDCLGDLDVDGRVILKWILKKCGESVNWIHFAHDRTSDELQVSIKRLGIC